MSEQLELPPEFLQGWVRDLGPASARRKPFDPRCKECGQVRSLHAPPLTHPYVEDDVR